MREFIIENLGSGGAVSLMAVLLNNAVAFIASFFIMFVYKASHSGTSYSRKFCISLGTITLVTTMIMSVISNNIALSLGMVGALSIIRFRTAVKDVRDATFIFWAIAVGIGCGVSQYILVSVGSIFLMCFLLVTKSILSADKRLLVVQGKQESLSKIKVAVKEHYSGKAHLSIENISSDICEVVYSVDGAIMKKSDEKNALSIGQRLMKIEGVERVNLIEQQDDISR